MIPIYCLLFALESRPNEDKNLVYLAIRYIPDIYHYTGLLTKKYSHNMKVESYFIWWECLGLWAQETASP